MIGAEWYQLCSGDEISSAGSWEQAPLIFRARDAIGLTVIAN